MVNRAEKYNDPRYEFSIAPDRPYIPREGLYPKAKWQQSVAPHPNLFLPALEPLPFEDAKKDLHELWTAMVDSRFGYKRQNEWGALLRDYHDLNEVAFGVNTEQLFKSFIVPAIKKHCGESNKNQVAIDNVSYLLPLWNKKELEPFQLVEGELSRLIKQGGKLPDSVGAVFLDFPPNQQKKDFQFNTSQLIRFIDNHSDVLFIIDQANLYFTEATRERVSFDDLMLSDIYYRDYDSGKITTHHKNLQDNNLAIVTNTTTKAVGLSGCAIAAGTKRTKELLGQELGHPAYFFDDESSINQARLSLLVESGKPGEPLPSQEDPGRFHPRPENEQDYDAVTAYQFRKNIVEYKKRLESRLKELFGDSVTCPELVVEGARIMINAKDLGFKKAKDLNDALFDQFSIGTKPATVYASPKKEREWAKYAQMTIPWNEEMLEADLEAFNKLYQMHKTKLRFAKVMKRLISV